MRELVDVAALNSRVKFDRMDVPFAQRSILGDATETGLARFAGRYISDYDSHQQKHGKVFEVPFNSANKWALVIVRYSHLHSNLFSLTRYDYAQVNKPHKAGQLTSYIKGAPERVLAKCSTYLKDGKPEPVSDEFKAAYEKAYDVRYFPLYLTLLRS